MLNLENYDFKLPPELIAQRPARPRDHARLLVYNRQTGQITDDYFYNLEKYLPAGSDLVINNTKVDKARLRFGDVEIFHLDSIGPTTITALVKPGRKFKVGRLTELGPLIVETLEIDGEGVRTLKLNMPIGDSRLDKYRQTPLPPYIAPNDSYSGDYQTVYAARPGSKAAPTAGLHFTSAQIKTLGQSHGLIKVTLNVGLGTFWPLRKEQLSSGKLHAEFFEISQAAAKQLNGARNLTAVGTTSLRLLESAAKPYRAQSGWTDLFIQPGHQFSSAGSMITNFHLPKSSLFILVATFLGSAEIARTIYAHAISQKYRFYSFGDAMIIV